MIYLRCSFALIKCFKAGLTGTIHLCRHYFFLLDSEEGKKEILCGKQVFINLVHKLKTGLGHVNKGTGPRVTYLQTVVPITKYNS